MPPREQSQLDTPGIDEGAATDEKGVGPVAREGRERRSYLAAGAGVEDLNLQSHGAGGRLDISQRRLGNRCMGRIDQHRDARCPRHQLAQ